MKKTGKVLLTITALIAVLSLAGADLAAAQNYGRGGGRGAGPGVYLQTGQPQAQAPQYGQGQRQGQRQRLQRRDGSCLTTAVPPAAPQTPAGPNN